MPALTRWYTLQLGTWAVMAGPTVDGGVRWLLVANGSILEAADSLGELLGRLIDSRRTKHEIVRNRRRTDRVALPYRLHGRVLIQPQVRPLLGDLLRFLHLPRRHADGGGGFVGGFAFATLPQICGRVRRLPCQHPLLRLDRLDLLDLERDKRELGGVQS